MITIHEQFIPAICEEEIDGSQPAGYIGLNASGKGKFVAVVMGPVEVASMGHSADGGQLDDGVYALRDILTFARNGERGLSIANLDDGVLDVEVLII